MNISDVYTIYERSTYDLIRLFGNIGGLLSFLVFFAGYIPKTVAANNLTALVAEAFYTWNLPKSWYERVKISTMLAKSKGRRKNSFFSTLPKSGSESYIDNMWGSHIEMPVKRPTCYDT